VKKVLIGMAAVLLLAVVGLVTAVSVCAARERCPKQSDCIIVLGAKVRPDGSMSDSLRYRCERALELWKDGVAPGLICCGGKGGDEPSPEGVVMREYFLRHGVPETRVIEESASVNTIENLRNARAVMEEEGWKTAVIVTSDYHVERALWIARDAGLDACGAAAPSPQGLWRQLYARLRESASWTLYGARRLMGQSA